jgi:hypothetical protein
VSFPPSISTYGAEVRSCSSGNLNDTTDYGDSVYIWFRGWRAIMRSGTTHLDPITEPHAKCSLPIEHNAIFDSLLLSSGIHVVQYRLTSLQYLCDVTSIIKLQVSCSVHLSFTNPSIQSIHRTTSISAPT